MVLSPSLQDVSTQSAFRNKRRVRTLEDLHHHHKPIRNFSLSTELNGVAETLDVDSAQRLLKYVRAYKIIPKDVLRSRANDSENPKRKAFIEMLNDTMIKHLAHKRLRAVFNLLKSTALIGRGFSCRYHS